MKHRSNTSLRSQSHPKQPTTQTSVGKVFAFIFWNVQGIFFINYFEKRRTIISKYYIALLVHLKEEITKKTATNEGKSALSSRWCTMSQVDRKQRQNYKNCTLNCFCIHPILQIWTPVTLKRMLQGKRFDSNEEVILETEAYFKAKDKLSHLYKKKKAKKKKKALNC